MRVVLKKLQKKLFYTLILLAPMTNHAQENEKKDSRGVNKLGQLSFFQEQNTFYSDTYISIFKNKMTHEYLSTNYSATNVIRTIKSFENEGYKLSESISYSFFKNHLVGFNIIYANERSEYDTTRTINYSYTILSDKYETKNKGFENPILYYKFRMFEQKKDDKSLNLDLVVDFSPDVFESKIGTYAISDPDEGTVASGNTKIGGGLTLSQNRGAFIWKADGQITYVTETTQKIVDGTYNKKTDPYAYFVLGGNGQYYFNDFIGLDFGLRFTSTPELNTNYSDNGSGNIQLKNIISDSYVNTQLDLGLNVNAISNRWLTLYVKLIGNTTNDYNVKIKYTQVGSFIPEDKYKVKDRSGSEILFGIKFLF